MLNTGLYINDVNQQFKKYFILDKGRCIWYHPIGIFDFSKHGYLISANLYKISGKGGIGYQPTDMGFQPAGIFDFR